MLFFRYKPLQLSSLKCSERFIERLWDIWCVISVIGIWPRFIEPACIFTKNVTIPIPTLPKELDGLRIVQFSDLHYSQYTSKKFLKRAKKRIMSLSADLIVFTGDLISYSLLPNTEDLSAFLSSLEAPLGCYAIFGNHDYSEYVSLTSDGCTRKVSQHLPAIMRGFARLFSFKDKSTQSPIVKAPIPELGPLRALFEKSGFTVLHNKTVQIGKNKNLINLTGLGDVMTGQCLASQAFANYKINCPGIVLSHNPDSYSLLENYPGDLFLFGHTHGGQVNLPYIWKRITPLKNKALKSGLFKLTSRFLYVNRGLGATFPFRWFAPPEITLLTLVREGVSKEPIWERLFPQETPPEVMYGTSRNL